MQILSICSLCVLSWGRSEPGFHSPGAGSAREVTLLSQPGPPGSAPAPGTAPAADGTLRFSCSVEEFPSSPRGDLVKLASQVMSKERLSPCALPSPC